MTIAQTERIQAIQVSFLDAYRLTGEVYHRYRLSLATIYERVLDAHYPQGFKAYDPEEIRRFREIVANEYRGFPPFLSFESFDPPKHTVKLCA